MKKMELSRYVARIGEWVMCWKGRQKKRGTRSLGDLDVDGILETYCVDWMYLILDMEPVAKSCEHSSGNSGPVKGRRFIDYVSDYKLL
jgi:hypothetical protein